MKIAILGAGAIGGHIAARLAQSGTPVGLIARGAQLDAIRARGLTLIAGDDRFTVHPRVTGQPAELGVQDVVVIAVKTPALASAMATAAPLIGPATRITFAMNGLPWWFLEGLNVAVTPELQEHLDPTGRMDQLVARERAPACVVTSGCRVLEPGVVENATPKVNILTFGFSDGRQDSVMSEFVARLVAGGFKSAVTNTIRVAIWTKLFINAAAAPVAALVWRSTSGAISDPEVRDLVAACIGEIIAIGRAIGVPVEADPLGITKVIGTHNHRPSVLQDLEAGRPLELANSMLAVRDIARATGTPAPHLTTVAALIAARGEKAPA